MQNYEALELEVVTFDNKDVITTSGDPANNINGTPEVG